MDNNEYVDTVVEYNLAIEGIKKYIMDLDYMDHVHMATEGLDVIPETVGVLTGYDLSTESSDAASFKSKLSELEHNVGGLIDRKLKKISILSSRVGEYNTSKLNELYSKIESGELVPSVNIDEKKMHNYNNKLGVFSASGYSLTYGCGDLIVFIKGIMDIASANSTYYKGLDNMRENLNTYKSESDIKALNGVLNLKKHLRGVSSSVTKKITITDYRMSIVSKWLSKNIDLITVSYHNRTGVNVSNMKLDVNAITTIGVAKNKDTLKLIELGLSNLDLLKRSHKSISILIKNSLSARIAGLLDSSKKEKRFIIAKYNEKIVTSLFNLYDDIASIDDLIIKYINITYETKKK